ncbi:hypothetical protein LCGC14_1047150 [marine sediment metagenome]|uniref:Uncharacterized protein n=1 Tax=marine sediment metagenome TaxID=412755 RepID=A0A0F9MUH5_9ZZZZ
MGGHYNMSVKKQGAEHYGRSYKDSVWGAERVSFWIVRLIFDAIMFFVFLRIFDDIFGIFNKIPTYMLFIFISYVCADVTSFLLAYTFIKVIFGLLHRKVKTLVAKIKYGKRMKKLWIYIFTILLETIFFYLSATVWLAGLIPIYYILSIVIAWIVLWMISKVLGRVIYFIFYTF